MELCEINKTLLEEWKSENEQVNKIKEFVESFAKAHALGKEMGIIVAIFDGDGYEKKEKD